MELKWTKLKTKIYGKVKYLFSIGKEERKEGRKEGRKERNKEIRKYGRRKWLNFRNRWTKFSKLSLNSR
jgi:hypothetical protein